VNKSVLVVGDGLLAHYVSELLEKNKICNINYQAEWTNQKPDFAADLALVLHDSWQPAIHLQAEKAFRQAGIPWLRGFVTFGLGMMGPLVSGDGQGCSRCADERRIMAEEDRHKMFQLRAMIEMHGGTMNDVWATSAGLLHMAYFLLAEIEQILVDASQSALCSHMVYVNLSTLATTRHFILSNPLCEVCANPQKDEADEARIVLEPCLKVGEDSYRCRKLNELGPFLEPEYLDNRTGLLNAKVSDLITPFAAVSVNLPLLVGDEGSGGRSHSYRDCTFTAILEGLERYCGIMPRAKKSSVFDAYANLQGQALNPAEVGLHVMEQYAKPDFPFQPYTKDLPLSWVWGYSLTQKRPILVPELLAYYSLGFRQGFVYETSNGCAIGNSPVEAIFHGILEVVERDSFLLTWYARLPLPRIETATIDDLEFKWMVDRIRTVAGYDIHLFNATMENGIPSVFAIAKNRRKTGLNLMCAGGSHPSPIHAVKGAVHEIAGMLLRFDEKLETGRARYLRMLHDSTKVLHMEDHSMLYGLPEAEERFSFLLKQDTGMVSFGDAFHVGEKHTDLTEDLNRLLAKFKNLGLDVIVVDQTSPELKRNGFSCVKVIIPGMLPMTFGHHLKRLVGLDRVLRIPRELGYAQQVLTEAELNPYPHPFP
jgi:ribosomal protein S12 methylthiotransferase accessory factor